MTTAAVDAGRKVKAPRRQTATIVEARMKEVFISLGRVERAEGTFLSVSATDSRRILY
jgi:hypothetical protein